MMLPYFTRFLVLPVLGIIILQGANTGRFSPRPAPGFATDTHTLMLADEKIWVHVYERPGSELVFVNLHDNENTCVEAAMLFLASHGGRLIELRHGRGREVVIRRAGRMYPFDPNRMFSIKGLRKSLAHFNDISDDDLDLASGFASEVIDLIAPTSGIPVIAIHNNSPGKLTIRDFMPGEWYGPDAQAVHTAPNRDPDDFFFTNSTWLYEALADLDHNVALMAERPPDRGTLGNYINNLGGLYIIVEAEHGHIQEQTLMLEDLGSLLRNR